MTFYIQCFYPTCFKNRLFRKCFFDITNIAIYIFYLDYSRVFEKSWITQNITQNGILIFLTIIPRPSNDRVRYRLNNQASSFNGCEFWVKSVIDCHHPGGLLFWSLQTVFEFPWNRWNTWKIVKSEKKKSKNSLWSSRCLGTKPSDWGAREGMVVTLAFF